MEDSNQSPLEVLATPTYISFSVDDLKNQMKNSDPTSNSIDIYVKKNELRVLARRTYNRAPTPEEVVREYIALDLHQLTPTLKEMGINPKEVDFNSNPVVEVYLSEPFAELPKYFHHKYLGLSNVVI